MVKCSNAQLVHLLIPKVGYESYYLPTHLPTPRFGPGSRKEKTSALGPGEKKNRSLCAPSPRFQITFRGYYPPEGSARMRIPPRERRREVPCRRTTPTTCRSPNSPPHICATTRRDDMNATFIQNGPDSDGFVCAVITNECTLR